MQLILSHHLFLTFCWAFHQPQHVWRNIFFHIYFRSQTCSFDTREDAKFYLTGFLNFTSEWKFSPLVWRDVLIVARNLFEDFLSLRQSWPSNLVREKTIVLFVSDHRASLLELVCHDWNFMSLLSNIVHVLSTQHTLPVSSPRMPSFLFDSWWLILFPQLRFGLWSFEFSSSDQYEVLQMSSIVNNLSVHWFERCLDRTTTPRRSEAEQRESFNFDLYNHSRIISEGISHADNRAWSHRTSKS